MGQADALQVQWLELFSRYTATACALDRELQAHHDLTASEFDVLERLVKQCTEAQTGCRMQELTQAVPLSQSALSRLVARLEREGLVTREMCSDDRRGIYASVTEEGRERYEQARPTQRAVLAEALAGHVEPLAGQPSSVSTSA
jgi:DNA-binding MarR family transcriptional regulator